MSRDSNHLFSQGNSLLDHRSKIEFRYSLILGKLHFRTYDSMDENGAICRVNSFVRNCDDGRKFEILHLPEEIHIPAAKTFLHLRKRLTKISYARMLAPMKWFFSITVLPGWMQRCHENFI